MSGFIVWLIVSLIFLGLATVSGYKAKDKWDEFQQSKKFEDVLKKNPPAAIEPNKTSWSISQILTGMPPDSLVMLAIILKYKPSNNLELIRLLTPFNFSPAQYNESIKRLILTGLVFVGHPADVKQSSPLYAPIIDANMHDEVSKQVMHKWFKDNWDVLFKNYLDIEPSFESIRKD